MPTARSRPGAGASGLDVHERSLLGAVACKSVVFSREEVPQKLCYRDNSSSIGKASRWRRKGRGVILFLGVLFHGFGVGGAVRPQAAEHQLQLNNPHNGVEQPSFLRSRQATVELHPHEGRRHAYDGAGIEALSHSRTLDSSLAPLNTVHHHVLLEGNRLSLLAQQEQHRGDGAAGKSEAGSQGSESTRTPSSASSRATTGNTTASGQTQSSASAAQGVSLPSGTSSSSGASPVAASLPSVITLPNITPLASVQYAAPVASSGVSSALVSTPLAGATVPAPAAATPGATLLPLPSAPSALVSVPPSPSVPAGPTIVPTQTGSSGLPVLSIAPSAGTPVGIVTNATALSGTSEPPAPSTILVPATAQGLQAVPVTAAISAPAGVQQAPSVIPVVASSIPAPAAPAAAAPQSSPAVGTPQLLTSVVAPVATTSAVPQATAPVAAPAHVPPPSAPVPAEGAAAGSEKEKTEQAAAGSGGSITAFSAGEKTCATDCTCLFLEVAAPVVLAACVIALLVEFILMGRLFSKGCLSKSFMRGGGWILLLAAALGLVPGLLTGWLASSCWTLALLAGGGFMAFAVAIVLVGTRGAWLGALGGAVSACTIAWLISPTALPLTLGGVAGLLGGIVIGFVPLLTGLEINVRYIRFRMRSSRGDTAARPRSTSRGGASYAPARQKRDSQVARDSHRSTVSTIESVGGGLRSALRPTTSPVESSDEATVIGDDLAAASRL